MTHKIKNKNSGLTLIETLFYTFVFAALAIVIINAMIHMTQSFRETSIQAELVQGADIMEKISREIKQAVSIHSISSNFLKLNTKDSLGANKTITFTASGGDLEMLENDVFIGDLNSTNIEISELSFSNITTSSGSAVKISFEISSLRDPKSRVYEFFNTLALRGSY